MFMLIFGRDELMISNKSAKFGVKTNKPQNILIALNVNNELKVKR